jgi:hypothetical protein
MPIFDINLLEVQHLVAYMGATLAYIYTHIKTNLYRQTPIWRLFYNQKGPHTHNLWNMGAFKAISLYRLSNVGS